MNSNFWIHLDLYPLSTPNRGQTWLAGKSPHKFTWRCLVGKMNENDLKRMDFPARNLSWGLPWDFHGVSMKMGCNLMQEADLPSVKIDN